MTTDDDNTYQLHEGEIIWLRQGTVGFMIGTGQQGQNNNGLPLDNFYACETADKAVFVFSRLLASVGRSPVPDFAEVGEDDTPTSQTQEVKADE